MDLLHTFFSKLPQLSATCLEITLTEFAHRFPLHASIFTMTTFRFYSKSALFDMIELFFKALGNSSITDTSGETIYGTQTKKKNVVEPESLHEIPSNDCLTTR